jgi:hypothetical protein
MTMLELLKALAEAPESLKEGLIGLLTVTGLYWFVTDGWIQILFWIVP